MSEQRWPPIDSSIEEAVIRQLHESVSIYDRSGVIAELEDKFQRLVGARFALLTSSGTAALHSAYYGLGIGPHDEVLVPAYTFFATATPLFQLGGLPILVDCNPRGELCLDEARRLLTPRTKALVVTYMWGTPGPIALYRDFCDENGLSLIEDCSHAHGAVADGIPAGSLGDVSIFSMQAAKTISAGEGGVLCTSDPSIYYGANLLGHFNKRALAEVPIDSALYRYAETGTGLKYRIHPVAAAIANVYIDRLEGWLASRRRVASQMFSMLRSSSCLSALASAGARNLGAYYAMPLVVSRESGLRPDGVVRLAQRAGISSADVPKSMRSLSTMEIFRNPVSPVVKYSESCIRRATPMAERIGEWLVKMNIPHSVESEEEFLRCFNVFLQMCEESRGSMGTDGGTVSLRRGHLMIHQHLNEYGEGRRMQAKVDGVCQMVVGGVLWREDPEGAEVLLVKRNADDFLGGWEELPGGGVDSGELLLDALFREMHEETGVSIEEVGGLINEFDYENESGERARQFTYSVRMPRGQAVRLNPLEHSEFRWISPRQVDTAGCTQEIRDAVHAWYGRYRAGTLDYL